MAAALGTAVRVRARTRSAPWRTPAWPRVPARAWPTRDHRACPAKAGPSISAERSADDRRWEAVVPVGPAEQVHHMDHRDVVTPALQTHGNLHDAARIGGSNHLSARLQDALNLPGQRLLSDLGVGQVVDPGRAAAPVRLGHLHERKTGNHAQQLPGLVAHALAMGQVTGFLVCHAQANRALRRTSRQGSKKLRRITDLLRKLRAPLLRPRIGAQLKLVL